MTPLAGATFRLPQFSKNLSLEGGGRWLLAWGDWGARAFDASTGAVLHDQGFLVRQALASGPWLAVARLRPEPVIELIDTSSFTRRHTVPLPADPQTMALSEGGEWLACWTKDGKLLQLHIRADAVEAAWVAREAAEHVALAFSPDGHRLALATHQRKARSCKVELFAAAEPGASKAKPGARGKGGVQAPHFSEERELKGARSAVDQLCFSPDGAELLAATGGAVLAWPLPTGKARALFSCKNSPWVVGFHENKVILTDAREAIAAVDLTSGRELWRHPHNGPAAMAAGKLVHGRFEDLSVRDLKTGAARHKKTIDGDPELLAVDAGREAVFVGISAGQVLRRWSLPAGALEPHPLGWGGTVCAAVFSGDRLAVGTREPAVTLWGPSGLLRLVDLSPEISRYNDCEAVLLDGDRLWAGAGRKVTRWSAATGKLMAKSSEQKDNVTALHLAADLNTLIACTKHESGEGKVLLLDPDTLKILHTYGLGATVDRIDRLQGAEVRLCRGGSFAVFDLHKRAVTSLSEDLPHPHEEGVFSPRGDLVVSQKQAYNEAKKTWIYSFVVFSLAGKSPRQLFKPKPTPSPGRFAFLDGGKRLLSLHEGALRCWDAASGKLLHEIAVAADSPSLLLASPDEKRALVACGDGSYALHELPPPGAGRLTAAAALLEGRAVGAVGVGQAAHAGRAEHVASGLGAIVTAAAGVALLDEPGAILHRGGRRGGRLRGRLRAGPLLGDGADVLAHAALEAVGVRGAPVEAGASPVAVLPRLADRAAALGHALGERLLLSGGAPSVVVRAALPRETNQTEQQKDLLHARGQEQAAGQPGRGSSGGPFAGDKARYLAPLSLWRGS